MERFVLPPGLEAIKEALSKTVFAKSADWQKALQKLEKAQTAQDAITALQRMINFISVHPNKADLDATETIHLAHRIADMYGMMTVSKDDTTLMPCPDPLPAGDESFDNLAGMEKEKENLRLGYIYPMKYKRLFRQGVRGVLFYGPPGTGKTSIARAAVAEFSGAVQFYNITPAKVKGKFVGETERNIENVFRCAREAAEANPGIRIIIFFDEFDALTASRDSSFEGADSRAVPVLLQMMQGVEIFSDRISVMAATNYYSHVDAAILRRFPVQIFVDMPDEYARMTIIYQAMAKNFTVPGVEVHRVLPQKYMDEIRYVVTYKYKDAKGEEHESEEEADWIDWCCLFEGNKNESVEKRYSDWMSHLRTFSRMLGPIDGTKLYSKRDSEKKGKFPVGYSSSDVDNVMKKAIQENAKQYLRCITTPTASSSIGLYFIKVRFRPLRSSPEMDSAEYYVGTRKTIEDLRQDASLLNLSNQVEFLEEVNCVAIPKGMEDKIMTMSISPDLIESVIDESEPTIRTKEKYDSYLPSAEKI